MKLIHESKFEKTRLLSVDAQFVSDEVLVRSQTWFLVSWSQRNKFAEGFEKYWFYNYLCCHTAGLNNLPLRVIMSKVDGLKTGEKSSTPYMDCEYCWMDASCEA